jgi:hypothetical protein
MPTSDDTLNTIFDLDPNTVVIDAETMSVTPAPVGSQAVMPAVPIDDADAGSTDALNHDVEYARGVMTENIDLVREATKSAILLAQSGDSPRAYEVVASMLTAIVNANKELVALHKAKEDTTAATRARVSASSSGGSGGGVNIEKAVFVGRAADLLRELRNLPDPKDK